MEEETKKIVCKNCGAEIKEGNNFCTNCGMKVVEDKTIYKENNNQTNQDKELEDFKYTKKEKITIIFIAIFVVIFMIYLLIRQGVIKIGGFYL